MLAATLALAVAVATGYVAGRNAARPTPGAAGVGATAVAGHAGHAAGGLQVTESGYTLVLSGTAPRAGAPGELTFQITGPDATPVTRFRLNHERFLHLILVGRDFTGYRHLHPRMDPDGTWRTPLAPLAAGAYRIFADFWPADLDRAITLGVDLAVPGRYAPRPLPPEEPTILVDGYAVTLDGGLRPGTASQVLVWLGRDGRPVPDLERYLGAYGHLVALRQGDLAYLHVHPALAREPSSVVAFTVQVPSAGRYRLFFEFQHGGTVRTAEFTLTAA